MKDLIERLEKATGPNFRLEQEIMWAVREIPPHQRSDHDKPPVYTVSIDAARTLVPEGFYWLVSEGRTRATEPLGGAQVFRPGYLVKPLAEAEHESAAIALCIAALKARAADNIHERQG